MFHYFNVFNATKRIEISILEIFIHFFKEKAKINKGIK